MLLCGYVYNVFVCVLMYLCFYVYLCVFMLRMCYDHGVCVFMFISMHVWEWVRQYIFQWCNYHFILLCYLKLKYKHLLSSPRIIENCTKFSCNILEKREAKHIINYMYNIIYRYIYYNYIYRHWHCIIRNIITFRNCHCSGLFHFLYMTVT